MEVKYSLYNIYNLLKCNITSTTWETFVALRLSIWWLSVLQKKKMRRNAGWSKAGGPLDIMKACQEITAGRGTALPQFSILSRNLGIMETPGLWDSWYLHICAHPQCSFITTCFLSWLIQLGAENSERCLCWATGWRLARWKRVGPDGASKWQHYGDEQSIPRALQRWSSHAGLYRYTSEFSLRNWIL